MTDRLTVQLQQYHKMQDNLNNLESRYMGIFTCIGVVTGFMVAFKDGFIFSGFNLIYWIIPLIFLIGLWGYCLIAKRVALLYKYLQSMEETINKEIKKESENESDVLLWFSQFLPEQYYNKFRIHKTSIPLFFVLSVVLFAFCLSRSFVCNNETIYYLGIVITLGCSVALIYTFKNIYSLNVEMNIFKSSKPSPKRQLA